MTAAGVGASGAAHVFEVTDLALELAPETTPGAGVVRAILQGGVTGSPGGLLLTAVSRVPVTSMVLVVSLGTFDAAGAYEVALPVSPALARIEVALRGGGLWTNGGVVLSNEGVIRLP